MFLPIQQITQSEADEQYKKLCKSNTDKMKLTNIGNKTTDFYFFNERLKVEIKKKSYYPSFHDILTDERLFKKYSSLASKWNLKTKMEKKFNFKALYNYYRLNVGSVSQFRPHTAMYVYKKLNAKNVLDFCAGWGGRLLGALALKVNYIGIDSNVQLKPGYEALIERYNTDSKVQMIFQPAESFNFANIKYDFVLTSPPYFDREIYQDMPYYPTFQNFMDVFLYPVVMNVFNNLDVGGTMCLNLPVRIYEALVSRFKPCDCKMLLKQRQRQHKHKGQRDYEEYIYCWHKVHQDISRSK